MFPVFGMFYVAQDVCMGGQVQCLYLSMQSVTKHRDRSLSLMGINWVSDRVGIDFTLFWQFRANNYSRLLRKRWSDSNEN